MIQRFKMKANIFQKTVFIFILAISFQLLFGCKSSAGGSTGGNPLDSSLPLQISADAQ